MATLQGFTSEQAYTRAYENAPFIHRDVTQLQLHVLHGSVRLRAWCRARRQPLAAAERLVSGTLRDIVCGGCRVSNSP